MQGKDGSRPRCPVDDGHPGHDPGRHGRRGDGRDDQEPAIGRPARSRSPVRPGGAGRPGPDRPGEAPAGQLRPTVEGHHHQRQQGPLSRARQESPEPSRQGRVCHASECTRTRRGTEVRRADRLRDQLREGRQIGTDRGRRLDRDDARRVVLPPSYRPRPDRQPFSGPPPRFPEPLPANRLCSASRLASFLPNHLHLEGYAKYVGWVEPRASPTIFRNAGGARPRLDPPYVNSTQITHFIWISRQRAAANRASTVDGSMHQPGPIDPGLRRGASRASDAWRPAGTRPWPAASASATGGSPGRRRPGRARSRRARGRRGG